MPSNPKLPVKLKWQPFPHARPVGRPTVAPDFFKITALRRSLSSIRYCFLCLEHWIAPAGWIREWVRINVLAVILIGTGVLLTGPVVTALLENLLQWADTSVKIMIKVMSMVSILPPLILAIVAGVFLWSLFKRRRGGRRGQHPSNHNQQFYE